MPFPKTYRTGLWWTVIASSAFGLVIGKGAIPRVSIGLVVFAGTLGALFVAWEHQWLKGGKKFAVVPLILLVASVFFWFVWPPHGLSVNPESVTYNSPDTSQNYFFSVKNNEDEAIYVAEIKLKVVSSALNTNSYQIYVPTSSLRPISDHSNFSDICGMIAVDKKNRPIFLFQIFYLAAHETREISLTHVGPGGSTTVYAIPSVYKTDPQPRTAESNKQVCTYYGPDEDIVNHGTFIVAMDGHVEVFDTDDKTKPRPAP